jgi:hypothetical protein
VNFIQRRLRTRAAGSRLLGILGLLLLDAHSSASAAGPHVCEVELTEMLRRYPIRGMEAKVSGKVVITFTVDKRGHPQSITVSGDARLASEPGSYAGYLHLDPRCRGQHVALTLSYSLDSSLPAEASPRVRKTSANDFDIVATPKDITIIEDPPVSTSHVPIRSRMRSWLGKLAFWR